MISQVNLLSHLNFLTNELSQVVTRFRHEEEAASAMEYGLLAALIGATIIGTTTALGSTVQTMYVTAVGTVMAAKGS